MCSFRGSCSEVWLGLLVARSTATATAAQEAGVRILYPQHGDDRSEKKRLVGGPLERLQWL